MVPLFFQASCVAVLLTAPAWAQVVLPQDFADDTVVTGLTRPNSMAFLPDGRVLLTELTTGKIRMVVNGHVAATDPAVVVDSLLPGSERGLQGIAIDPRWPQSPYVYVCYTHIEELGGSRMVLVRYTASGDLANPSGENLTLGSKRTLIHNFMDMNDNHNGLGLRFGTDGKLLMTTGDDLQACGAQVLGSLLGKLFRLEVTRVPSGPGGPVPRAMLIPSDNPYVGPDSNAALVYAQGFRNPWRFHVDALTGGIVLADVGEGTFEELDDIVARGNYGWPYREGSLVATNPCCVEPPGSQFNAPFVTPDHVNGYRAILTAGIYRPAIGGASNWAAMYEGNLFYCDYYLGKLRRMVRVGSAWMAAPPVAGQPSVDDWATGLVASTDFAVGTDGSLWWITEGDASAGSGMVKRIRYTSTIGVPYGSAVRLTASPNPFRDQVMLAWVSVASGPAVLEIFDMAGRRVHRSTNAGSGTQHYTWDGKNDQGADVPAGLYVVRLRHDGQTETQRVLRVR